MNVHAKLYVAGHRGLVGSALVRKLRAAGYDNLVLRSSAELDLRDQAAVAAFFAREKPDYVFLAAARVGGIVANNSYPAQFIYDNLQIQNNVIHNAWLTGVKRLLFLGSTCIYPKLAPQPLKEEYLLTGPLEPTNDAYAVAKIAGITLCRSYNRQYGTNYLAAMPTNLYGPGDNFDLENSHVLPALIRKFHEAKGKAVTRDSLLVTREESEHKDQSAELSAQSPVTSHQSPEPVVIWGTGTPLREFLHVDDLADGSLFLMNLPEDTYQSLITGQQSPITSHESPVTSHQSPALINIGSGEEISISDLALLVKEVVGFQGKLEFDRSKPDGTPRKLSDVTKLHGLGWRHRIGLAEGIRTTYAWYQQQGA